MSLKRIILIAVVVLAGAAFLKLKVFAHCQIPCGIYDDPARFTELAEHATTIEKAMKEVIRISGEDDPDWNQAVRWVQNKDDHADKFTSIVSYYFMAQRIKPKDPDDPEAYKKYVHELTLLHQMIVHSMKAKQTSSLEHVAKLRSLIGAFRASYLGG